MIVFTEHALLKLGHRGIKQEVVIRALRNPDYQMPTYKDRKAAFKKINKLYLKVVFRKEGGNIIVITQHWVDKIS